MILCLMFNANIQKEFHLMHGFSLILILLLVRRSWIDWDEFTVFHIKLMIIIIPRGKWGVFAYAVNCPINRVFIGI